MITQLRLSYNMYAQKKTERNYFYLEVRLGLKYIIFLKDTS